MARAVARPRQALAWFERFLEFEPRFAPLCDYALDDEFYYLKRYLPSSVEALKRAARATYP